MSKKTHHHKRPVGTRRVTYSGRIVYDRAPQAYHWLLPNVARIFDKIMALWNENDPVDWTNMSPTFRRQAPTSTIFYFNQQSAVWLHNRGYIFKQMDDRYTNEIRPEIQEKSASMDSDQFVNWLSNFLKYFDQGVQAYNQALTVLAYFKLPGFELLIKINQAIIKLWNKVYEEYGWAYGEGHLRTL